MEPAFRPAPLAMLARWIFRDLETRDTVLGLPRENFQIPHPGLAVERFGHTVAAPLGVAAGPQTQLAQNIVAAWLCGARFMELKTVQILDELQVGRPCIDAAEETYNCEWSQELKLEQSFQEYLNAWVLIHALAHRFGLQGPGTHFAMSVGYNLEGIRSERVQTFIANMRDAGEALPRAIDAVALSYPPVRDLPIPSRLSNHITLSTMHGCPPAEIERIASYLLTDLGVDTWVKLNPTLLGPERLRGLLNGTQGFAIEVPDAAFAHDPTFDDAVAMARNLATLARSRHREFGLKLSNTLEVVNHRPVFPDGETMMYLSGRALHPLTLALADRVAEALDGAVPISFCGGAEAGNFPDLVADGLGPVTVCSDLLKPGGYARLQQYLVNLEEAMAAAGATSLDGFTRAVSGGHGARFNLARHAIRAAGDAAYARRPRPLAFKGPRALGAFDCIAAPCAEACPAHQNIPDYLWLVAHGRPGEAMDVILRTNPQPGVTGSVCDHPCTGRCVRNFYDAPLAIRELKRFAFEQACPSPEVPGTALGVKVAVAGAGPAGLSAAYFLARMGFELEVFEARAEPGGMVSGVIPGYRLAPEALDTDLERLRALGVTFHFGTALGRDRTLEDLRGEFPYVFLGVGAQRGRRLGIPFETAPGVLDALVFLDQVRCGTCGDLGRRVLVIGGGNSAMDAARSARRLVKDGTVTLVYRRTRAEMPADPAEVRDCLEEGIGLRDLLAPASVAVEAGRAVGLLCTRMELGERDGSGRPRPVAVAGAGELLPADTIIVAISQEAVLTFLDGLDVLGKDGALQVHPKTRETRSPGLFAGGDAIHGPASVVQAIADGRAAAEAIGRRHGLEPPPEPHLDKALPAVAALAKKGRTLRPETVPVLPLAERGSFREVLQAFGPEAAALEAGRCLDCDEVCSLCVTVCPNRANLAYAVKPFTFQIPILVMRQGRLVAEGAGDFRVAQAIQTLNLGDFCNECGNCDTFCPAQGAPYRDKPRFWLDEAGFREARGDAYRMEALADGVLLRARLAGEDHRLEVRNGVADYRGSRIHARFQAPGWNLLGFEPVGTLAEGEQVDLAPCAKLLTLLFAQAELPGCEIFCP